MNSTEQSELVKDKVPRRMQGALRYKGRIELDLNDEVKGNPRKSHCACGPQVTGVSSKQVPTHKSLLSPENPADTLSG